MTMSIIFFAPVLPVVIFVVICYFLAKLLAVLVFGTILLVKFIGYLCREVKWLVATVHQRLKTHVR